MADRDQARGKRIKQFRKLAGLSQEELARAAGVKSGKTAYMWEQGYGIKPTNVRAVAKALGRTVEEIQGRAETPDPFKVTAHIDRQLEVIVHEFRGHVDRMLDRNVVDAESVRGLLDKQSDILNQIQGLLQQQSDLLARIQSSQGRIEEFVETLPAGPVTRQLLEALSGADPSDGLAQPGPAVERPAAPGTGQEAGQ